MTLLPDWHYLYIGCVPSENVPQDIQHHNEENSNKERHWFVDGFIAFEN